MYATLMYVHLATITPCIFVGGYLLMAKKGGAIHRLLGKIYMALMLFSAVVTLFMPAKVGPQFLGHFGYIHLLSILTIYTIPTALSAIRRGQVRSHQRKMKLLYFGGMVLAGGFTLFPGRYLHELFWGC